MESKFSPAGYVLSLSKRGEYGSLAKILTKDGMVVASASNGNRISGKNIPLGSLTGCLCQFDLARKDVNSPFMLRGVTVARKYVDFSENLDMSLFFLLAEELITKTIYDDKDDEKCAFLVYERCLELLSDSKKPLPSFVLLLAKSFEFLGFMPEVGGCVNCSNTSDIITFSFEEGGFLCRNCAREFGLCGLERKTLLTYKYLFSTPLEDSTPDRIDGSILRQVSDSMVLFLKEEYGTSLESYEMFMQQVDC